MTDQTGRQNNIAAKVITRLFLLGLGLCLPLLFLEAGVRLVSLAPPAQPNPAIWAPHPLFGWWHIPYSGGTFYSDFNEFEAEVRINARGLRDREIGYDNPDSALRILSLADSFGEALQVDLADTYHKQLEARLIEQLGRPVEVINAGVGGWGTDQEAIFFVAEGFRYEPDVVMLSFFIRNDAVNNYGPLEIARNGGVQRKEFFTLAPDGQLIPPAVNETLAAELEAAVTEVVEGQQIHPEFAVEEVKPPLLGAADVLWRWSSLYRFMMPHLRDVPSVLRAVGPSGLLGGEAVIRAKHPAVPVPFFVYQSPPNEEFEAAWTLTEAIIARLRDEVEGRGIKFAVVLVAAPEQLNPA
ncbi:MAG: SGNH/GDSL hydrolase family protein, partial [Anaerolineae bacterium]|nr:SGNH/GDSL hydrolase family protein [Anaerolineae bacterium]